MEGEREEFVVAVVAALGIIVFGALFGALVGALVGVLVAVVISVVVALYRIARPHDAVLGDYLDADGWVDVGAYPTASGSASNRPCQTIRVRRSGWCSISKASALCNRSRHASRARRES